MKLKDLLNVLSLDTRVSFYLDGKCVYYGEIYNLYYGVSGDKDLIIYHSSWKNINYFNSFDVVKITPTSGYLTLRIEIRSELN